MYFQISRISRYLENRLPLNCKDMAFQLAKIPQLSVLSRKLSPTFANLMQRNAFHNTGLIQVKPFQNLQLEKNFFNSRNLSDKVESAKAEKPKPHSDKFMELFSSKRIKRNYELIPLFAIVGAAVVALCGFVVYSFKTRDDISLGKFSRPNYETIDVMKPPKRKLLVFNQEYRPMTELNDAYKAMESEETVTADKKK